MNRSTKFAARNPARQSIQVAGPDQVTLPLREPRDRRRARRLDREPAGDALLELQRVLHERERLTEIGGAAVKIVHDLGNLLTALAMQAQIIVQKTQRDAVGVGSTIEKPAQRILATVQLLQSIVDDLGNFARDHRLELNPVALTPFLLECVECWQPLASRRGVGLTLTRGPALPPLRADEVLIRRVVDNLIKNAIEAVGEGPGEVTLSAYTPYPGIVRIAVEDSGPGIPAGLEVFKLFETTKPDGTGIGLAVARQLVTAHGGGITHESREAGGTRFCIDLPLEGPPTRRPRRATDVSEWCPRGRGLRAERAS